MGRGKMCKVNVPQYDFFQLQMQLYNHQCNVRPLLSQRAIIDIFLFYYKFKSFYKLNKISFYVWHWLHNFDRYQVQNSGTRVTNSAITECILQRKIIQKLKIDKLLIYRGNTSILSKLRFLCFLSKLPSIPSKQSISSIIIVSQMNMCFQECSSVMLKA